MGILRRARERGEAFLARHLHGEAVAFAAEIPGSDGPLASLRVEAESKAEGDGEHVRLRAHFTLRLRPAPALPRPAAARPALPARVGRWIERRLSSRLARFVAAPLLRRDVSAWVEVNASSAALDEGSTALVPERLKALGVEPDARKPVQTWAGALRGRKPGVAMLTLLQLDKERLPPPLQQALGEKPFQMSATVVNVIEDA